MEVLLILILLLVQDLQKFMLSVFNVLSKLCDFVFELFDLLSFFLLLLVEKFFISSSVRQSANGTESFLWVRLQVVICSFVGMDTAKAQFGGKQNIRLLSGLDGSGARNLFPFGFGLIMEFVLLYVRSGRDNCGHHATIGVFISVHFRN